MKSFLSLALIAVAGTTFAQLKIDTLTGSFSGFSVGDTFSAGVLGSSSHVASINFSGSTSELAWPAGPYGSRGIVRFQSSGVNNMSSDNKGNKSASFDNEVRKFTTMNNDFLAENLGPGVLEYKFSSETSVSNSIQIKYFDFTESRLNGSVQSGTLLGLDNSVYDLDPTPFKIKIDKSVNAFISSTSSVGAGSVNRGLYDDGDSDVASPFYDGMFTTVEARILQGGVGVGQFSSTFSNELALWNPGEDEFAVKTFDALDLNMGFNFSTLANGTYDLAVYSAVWQRLGGETISNITGSAVYPGTSNSAFAGSESSYTLEVVPEPGTMIALSAGLMAFLRRRKK